MIGRLMKIGRLSTFAAAALSMALGIWFLRSSLLILIAPAGSRPTFEMTVAAALSVCGIICMLGAFLLAKRLLDDPRVTLPPSAPRFGRYAAGSTGRGTRLVPVLAATMAIGIGLTALREFGQFDEPQTSSGMEDIARPAAETPQVSVAPPSAKPDPISPPPASPQTEGSDSAKTEVPETPIEPAQPPAVGSEQNAPLPPSVTSVPMPKPEAMPSQAQGHRDAVVWLSLSPDGGSFLSTSTDRTIKLWDMAGERLIRTVASHSDMARVATFLPDGERIVTAGDDGEIVLRDLADGSPQHVFSTKDHGRVNKIAVSADGGRMVSGHQAGTVLFWDLRKRVALHVERAHGWPVAGVAISDDGTRALSGSIDGDLKLWDVESGTLVRYWGGHERGAYGMAFTRDGKQAVTGSGDRTIKLWDLKSGRLLRQFDGHSQTVYAIVLSHDGTRILSGSLDGTARLWDLENGTEIAQYVGHRGPVYSVAFGPEGTVLTGGYDRSIRIWREAGPPAVAVLAGAPQ